MNYEWRPRGGAHAGAAPPLEPDLPLDLQIAVERGYLRPVQAKLVLARCRERREPVAGAIRALGYLSERRLQRLQNHVRYRVMRREDKRYARLAQVLGLLDGARAARGLAEQRRRFGRDRERIRLGTLLVAEGALTREQDRDLIRRLSAPVESAAA